MKNMSKITQDEEKLVQCNETCVKDDNNNEDPWLAKVGTLVEAQSACLNLLGVKGAMPSKESPGANSRQLATIVGYFYVMIFLVCIPDRVNWHY
ncbi:hypothetical protein RYX36_015947 [Vicia faba]